MKICDHHDFCNWLRTMKFNMRKKFQSPNNFFILLVLAMPDQGFASGSAGVAGTAGLTGAVDSVRTT